MHLTTKSEINLNIREILKTRHTRDCYVFEQSSFFFVLKVRNTKNENSHSNYFRSLNSAIISVIVGITTAVKSPHLHWMAKRSFKLCIKTVIFVYIFTLANE